MGSKWPVVKLRDIVEFNTGKLNSNAAKTDGKYPFFTCSPETLFIDEYVFDCEAVLLAGNNANGVFGVKYFNGKFNAYQRTYVITPKKNVHIDVKWLYFQICHVTAQLQKLSVGTATKFLTKAILDAFEVKLPPLAIQISMSHQLWTLESKITLNRQINQTLEQMAQTLFKSWFVDFDPVIDNALDAGNDIPDTLLERTVQRRLLRAKADFKPLSAETRALFPSEFEETELGWVPKGWASKFFDELVDKYIDNRGKTPPIEFTGIPLIEVKHLSDTQAFPNLKTEKRVSKETFNTWFRAHLEHKDILISTVGTIGRTSFVKNAVLAIAQNVLGLRFGNVVTPEYMFYAIKNEQFQNDMSSRLVTTVQASIKRKDLNTIPVLVPSFELMAHFSTYADLLLSKQYKASENIDLLVNFRDALLPKLISGELALNDLPVDVAEAVEAL